MKHKSDNFKIQNALNQTWYITGVFYLVTFGLMIFGFHLAGKYEIGWLYPVSVFGSIGIGGYIMIYLANKWFSYWLIRIDDPYELYRRTIRLNMILPSKAKKIADKYGIELTRIKSIYSPKQLLPTITVNKKVTLSNDEITIDQQPFRWTDIRNFEFRPYSPGERSLFGPTLDLILIFNNQETLTFPLKVFRPNPLDLEYNIDKYLENSRKN